MTQNDLSVISATRVAVGLSAIIRLAPGAFNYAEGIKIFSGGSSGTVEFVQCPAAFSGVGAAGWGTGYQIGTNEVVNLGGPAVMYLAATGVTMVMAMYIGQTSGATAL